MKAYKNFKTLRSFLRAKIYQYLGIKTLLSENPSQVSFDTIKHYSFFHKLLKITLKGMNKFPAIKFRLRRVISRFPDFEKALFRGLRQAKWADILSQRDLNFDEVGSTVVINDDKVANPNNFIQDESAQADTSKSIYYWIDHTVQCQTNTGVQRVVRGLAEGLVELNTNIIFVCWDDQRKGLVKATKSDLVRLSSFNGPKFSHEFLSTYPDTSLSSPLLQEQIRDEQLKGAWLLVPEVTYITFHMLPMTLPVIDYTKTLGMKTAFIFYDAIPIKLKEYSAASKAHTEYMKCLGLADLVIPISRFSAGDLSEFLTSQFYFQSETLPVIQPILLPGEICGTPRVTEVHQSDEKFVILSVGSIEPRKNQLKLLEAFQRLCECFPDKPLKLVLVGNVSTEFAPIFCEAIRYCSKVEWLKFADDKKLKSLYEKCVFTVFPSVEEGFGLPIVESLWKGKPVICANFGAMAEIAQEGGCLMIDTYSVTELENAMRRLLFDKKLRENFIEQAVSRPVSSWRDYGNEILTIFRTIDDPVFRIKKIYYWVDHTCSYPSNTGIQRVVRGLARALQSSGICLIPVKWDQTSHSFYSPTTKEIEHLAAWNGPDPAGFSPFSIPEDETSSLLLIPELTTYKGGPELDDVVRVAQTKGLHTSIIFYDALPCKLSQLYPPEVTVNHSIYMKKLMKFDYILPISNTSSADLRAFLFQHGNRLVNISKKLNPAILPGEFLEQQRVTSYEEPENSTIRILCVCTIEPRKNQLVLLDSFDRLCRRGLMNAELVLIGKCDCPLLEEKVSNFLQSNSRIKWLHHVDDATLGREYSRCHFTVYPSLDEGFGLPVLESLWNGRPCICRNAGALAETALGGGCLIVDTSDTEELAKGISLLVNQEELRSKLRREAVDRYLKSWNEYGNDILKTLACRMGDQNLKSSLKQPTKSSFPKKTKPLLSICITTYNRAKWLEIGLNTLMQCVEPYKDLIEVLVCDNDSEDRTHDVAKLYQKKENFRYHRNPKNVGMLKNLEVTVSLAHGKYVWILGDDDIIKEGAVENILEAIRKYPDLNLIYLNYAYTSTADANEVTNIDQFLCDSIPIVSASQDHYAKIKDLATKSENFFTGIYCLVFRHDHALKAYSQNTSGRPFSTMLTCIPTSCYVCNEMFEEMGLWIGQPAVVVNMNVSWAKYAPLWILERLPELYDLAEEKGAAPEAVDRWRTHNFPGVLQYVNEIYHDDKERNLPLFSIDRLIQRYKHLPIFRENLKDFFDIYSLAYAAGKATNSAPPEILKQRYNL